MINPELAVGAQNSFARGGTAAIQRPPKPSTINAIAVLCALCTALSGQDVRAASHEIPNFEKEASNARQQTPVWCWAASIQAVLAHYGINRSQQDIVTATFGAPVVSAAADPRQLYNALVNNRFTGSSLEITRGAFQVGSPSGTFLVSEITADHPVILWYNNPGGGGHSVVVFGVDYDAMQNVSMVEYFDPWDGDSKIATRPELAPRVACYFAIRAASIKAGDERPNTDEHEERRASRKSANQDPQAMQQCLNRKVRSCIEDCMDNYGYSRDQCVNTLCTLNPFNLSKWRPACERELRKRAEAESESDD